jgi:hypothetical protein
MKKWLIVFYFAALLSGCGKKEDLYDYQQRGKIQDGIYMGYFEYQNQKYWSEIEFSGNKFVEWPSGGALYQKSYGCLTVGTYEASGYHLKFRLANFKMPGFPEKCVGDMLLPGDYTLYGTVKSDSIVIKRGSGNNSISYYLKRIP